MAYLDPRQLSTSLSTIIPELVGVLNDSHREVRNSANQSLKKFGDVIKNPEIQSLVPVLIKAISDPTQHTEEALDGLLKTRFVHYIDAPSLALVIHILHRGLKDRSANIKRKAAQIVGNMAILTDSNDLIPYLPILISELETSMVDPVPATRSTASRSIGALVEKLGEDQFPDLIPRLMSTLKAKDRVGDRLGSAQGLAEIIYGLGIHKLEELLPIILKNCTASQSHVREGFMPLLIYLPGAFSSSFSPYLSQIIPPILSGLADDVEGVRETSIKAGRLVITNFAAKAVDLLCQSSSVVFLITVTESELLPSSLPVTCFISLLVLAEMLNLARKIELLLVMSARTLLKLLEPNVVIISSLLSSFAVPILMFRSAVLLSMFGRVLYSILQE